MFYEVQLQVAESRSRGSVAGEVYSGYLRAGGNWCVIIIVFLFFVLAQMSASGGDFFISQWVNMEEKYVGISVLLNVSSWHELI